jgi:hypothetical protein
MLSLLFFCDLKRQTLLPFENFLDRVKRRIDKPLIQWTLHLWNKDSPFNPLTNIALSLYMMSFFEEKKTSSADCIRARLYGPSQLLEQNKKTFSDWLVIDGVCFYEVWSKDLLFDNRTTCFSKTTNF